MEQVWLGNREAIMTHLLSMVIYYAFLFLPTLTCSEPTPDKVEVNKGYFDAIYDSQTSVSVDRQHGKRGVA